MSATGTSPVMFVWRLTWQRRLYICLCKKMRKLNMEPKSEKKYHVTFLDNSTLDAFRYGGYVARWCGWFHRGGRRVENHRRPMTLDACRIRCTSFTAQRLFFFRRWRRVTGQIHVYGVHNPPNVRSGCRGKSEASAIGCFAVITICGTARRCEIVTTDVHAFADFSYADHFFHGRSQNHAALLLVDRTTR